jgi:hypothetical protein
VFVGEEGGGVMLKEKKNSRQTLFLLGYEHIFYACYNYQQERERTGRGVGCLFVHLSLVESHNDDDVQDSSSFFSLRCFSLSLSFPT